MSKAELSNIWGPRLCQGIIRENGTPIKILGAFRDITEQRKTEEKLRQSLKMESIGRLAGGVAHDFNNKLTVILGYAELIKLEYPDNLELLGQLSEIISAAQHSRDITAQLLTFSRQQIISLRSTCLNAVIKEMQRSRLGDSQPIADNKTIKGQAKNRRVDFTVSKI